MIEFFSPHELTCHCGVPNCGAPNVDKAFLDRLIALRQVFGQPMLLTSTTRCKKHNAVVSGRANSPHLRGIAADVSCPDGVYMLKLFRLADKMGFRVGVKNRMLHLDLAEGQQVMFGY